MKYKLPFLIISFIILVFIIESTKVEHDTEAHQKLLEELLQQKLGPI